VLLWVQVIPLLFIIMPKETSTDASVDINSENIFDEFTGSQDIQQELDQNDKNNEKDIYYYMKKVNTFLHSINILIFLWVICCFWYIYIQNNEEKTEYSFLSPMCSLFLWRDTIYPNTCYGVTPTLREYTNRLDALSLKQSESILPLLWDRYSLENYNLSKKVNFILSKWEDRLRPLEILSEFDKMKDIFSSTDKSEITCYDIFISQNAISMTCDSFSSDWNTDILSVENTLLKTVSWGGTSISKASSFVNFFEKYTTSPFIITQKPEFYTSEAFQSWPYTRRTTFEFSLLYTQPASLEIN